jgi:hypothetical protein
MAFELVYELVRAADLGVELDRRVPGNGERLSVGREGMVGDGVVEEVVDLGGCHDEYRGDRRSSLLPRSGWCWGGVVVLSGKSWEVYAS